MKEPVSCFKPLLLGMLLAGGLVATHVVRAESNASGSVQTEQIKQDAIAAAEQAAKQEHAKYRAEAIAAVKAVEEAAALLEEGKSDEAITKLEEADGKLAIAIAADPTLKLIPVAASVMTYDLATTPDAVTAELEAVDNLLEAGNVQAARVRLSQLRSEIVTNYVFLPVATYPDAIKRAVTEITAKQSNKARETLAIAMGSLVEEAQVTPLPVVLAHGAILEAEAVQKSDADEALRDLDYASEQIETAERLGYFHADKDGYKAITSHIEELQHVITGASKTQTLFERAKNSMKTLLDKFKHKNTKPTQ